MDGLDGTSWDVVVVGTDIQQSLLALALSRSGKRVLHVDENDYYGGTDAAFSLQEAEAWANSASEGAHLSFFRNAIIFKADLNDLADTSCRLSFSRAYSLALSPRIIYSLSSLLPVLVSSKVYRQLEFQAVGSWWVSSLVSQCALDEGRAAETYGVTAEDTPASLTKIPNGREDIFTDKSVDLREKRQLMKFLKFVVRYDEEEQLRIWQPHRSKPFQDFLSIQFQLSSGLRDSLMALTLTQISLRDTSTSFALPRIAKHLRSIGVFGPGFGSLTPKWGGLAEVAQVACRAGAVGGGVYVLSKKIKDIGGKPGSPDFNEFASSEHPRVSLLRLDGGDTVFTDWIVGLEGNIPFSAKDPNVATTSGEQSSRAWISRIIAIVSSPANSLFPPTSESGPVPSGAVVTFHPDPLDENSAHHPQKTGSPVHILVHASDTGECPTGQCVLYASTSLSGEAGFELLDRSIARLLQSLIDIPAPVILWSMRYEQSGQLSSQPDVITEMVICHNNILCFPAPSLDLVFDDNVIDRVRHVWQKITGEETEGFMRFNDRDEHGETEAAEAADE